MIHHLHSSFKYLNSMTTPFQCDQCGNPRELLGESCPHCSSDQPPRALVKYWRVDFHETLPEAEDALAQLDAHIRAGAAAGLRGMVVIHGYGSSGKGGRLGPAIREQLQINRWSQYVKEYVPGEELLHNSETLTHWTRHRAALADFLKRHRLLGNAGVTLLILN